MQNLFDVINKSVKCEAEKGIQASLSYERGLTAAGESEAVESKQLYYIEFSAESIWAVIS